MDISLRWHRGGGILNLLTDLIPLVQRVLFLKFKDLAPTVTSEFSTFNNATNYFSAAWYMWSYNQRSSPLTVDSIVDKVWEYIKPKLTTGFSTSAFTTALTDWFSNQTSVVSNILQYSYNSVKSIIRLAVVDFINNGGFKV